MNYLIGTHNTSTFLDDNIFEKNKKFNNDDEDRYILVEFNYKRYNGWSVWLFVWFFTNVYDEILIQYKLFKFDKKVYEIFSHRDNPFFLKNDTCSIHVENRVVSNIW